MNTALLRRRIARKAWARANLESLSIACSISPNFVSSFAPASPPSETAHAYETFFDAAGPPCRCATRIASSHRSLARYLGSQQGSEAPMCEERCEEGCGESEVKVRREVRREVEREGCEGEERGGDVSNGCASRHVLTELCGAACVPASSGEGVKRRCD